MIEQNAKLLLNTDWAPPVSFNSFFFLLCFFQVGTRGGDARYESPSNESRLTLPAPRAHECESIIAHPQAAPKHDAAEGVMCKRIVHELSVVPSYEMDVYKSLKGV